MCPVPHRGGRGQAQAGAQPQWGVREENRTGGRLHLHPGQHREGDCMERRDPGHLPREPQEVHPWHQDGLRGAEEEEGQIGPDCLHQGSHKIDTHADVILLGRFSFTNFSIMCFYSKLELIRTVDVTSAEHRVQSTNTNIVNYSISCYYLNSTGSK